MTKKDANYYSSKAKEIWDKVERLTEQAKRFDALENEAREKERNEQIRGFADSFEQALHAAGAEDVRLDADMGREAAAAYIATRELETPLHEDRYRTPAWEDREAGEDEAIKHD